MIKVVCGIIYKDGRVLITRRKEGKSLAGYWEFPGGKIDLGELENEALTRELEEELDMEVQIFKRLGEFIHHYENFSLSLIGFKCKLINWNGIMTDHDKAEWILPHELIKYKFAEADLPFVKIIRNDENQV